MNTNNTTPEQEIRVIADFLIRKGYLRQFERNRWCIAAWHPLNLYPDVVRRNTVVRRQMVWRQAGLKTPYSSAVWDAAFMLLPEIPSLKKLTTMPDQQVKELRKRVSHE